MPPEASFSGAAEVTTFPYRTGIVRTIGNPSFAQDSSGEIVATGYPGYAIVELTNKIGTGSEYAYAYIFVDERPSEWTPAKTAD